tara:strand:+ start:120 stop:248 length:129 start_codon:yes stop_codon:yes gene_type:complete
MPIFPKIIPKIGAIISRDIISEKIYTDLSIKLNDLRLLANKI